MIDPRIEPVLARCPVFSRLREDARERVAALVTYRTVAKRHCVVRQGEPCAAMYVVATGLARVFQLNANGKEHTLHLVEPNRTFAEIAALDGGAYPASAEAVEPCELLELPAGPLQDLLAADHDLCRQLLVGLAGWVRHTIDSLEDIALRDAVGRVASHCLRHADGHLRFPSSERQLALQVNLTPETCRERYGAYLLPD